MIGTPLCSIHLPVRWLLSMLWSWGSELPIAYYFRTYVQYHLSILLWLLLLLLFIDYILLIYHDALLCYSFSSLSLYSFPWWISELFVAPSQDAVAGAPTKKAAPKEKAATASVAAANTGDDGDDGSTAIKANNVEKIWDIVRAILTA